MGERLSEDNSITIVPLHCYSPPVRAGDSPLESSSWISRSITEGFWGESRLPAMRPKYGVRIPECSHTQRLLQIAVLRDIFSSSLADIDSFVTQKTFDHHGKLLGRLGYSLGVALFAILIWIMNLHSWTFLCQKFNTRYIFALLVRKSIKVTFGIKILCEKMNTCYRENDDIIMMILIFLSTSIYRELSLLDNVYLRNGFLITEIHFSS